VCIFNAYYTVSNYKLNNLIKFIKEKGIKNVKN
jgi:uncharacterized Rmd1/YagE family protein